MKEAGAKMWEAGGKQRTRSRLKAAGVLTGFI
jgi:hypothetical protein